MNEVPEGSDSLAQLLEADSRARRRALDPRGSFLVQAPAGSGKTTLLAARYLTLLATVEHPEEIVALTFTRKAAGEMAQRVLDALAAVPTAAADGGGGLEGLAARVHAHARRRGWDEDELPLRLRIHTIDQLALGIVRRMPQRFAAGAFLTPTEEADPLYRAAARLLLEDLDAGGEIARAVRTLLLHLDDPGRFLELVARMLARREQWLPLLAAGADRDRLARAWNVYLEERVSAVGDPPGGRAEAAEWLARLGLDRGDDLSSRLRRLRALARSLLRKDEKWYAAKSGHHALRALDALGVETIGERADWLAVWSRLRAAFATDDTAPPPRWLVEIARLPDPALGEEEATLLDALVLVLARAVDRLGTVFRRERRVDFTEITRLAHNALGEDEAPTDLQLALDYRIRHLLVDEFQDTSLTHYAFLARLVRGWTLEDGRSFFAVGDPMQSIYRFRQADVAVFLEVRRRGRLGDLPLVSLELHRNFRSAPAVVDWVNRFEDVFPPHDDPGRGAVRYVRSVAARPHDPAADVFCIPVTEVDEVDRLVERVTGAEDAGGRRAILLRTRRQAASIVTALRARGVSLRLVDIVALAAVPAVEDLLALSEALLHPGSRRSWFAVLRAPWCGLGNPALAALAALGDPPGIRLLEGASPAGLTESEAALLTGALPTLVRGVEGVARHGLRRGVEATWVALGGPALLDTESDLRAAERFLDLLEEPGIVDLWRLDPGRFEERVRTLHAPEDPSGGDAVEILTVHGAKGLEWDSVFLPALGRKTRPNDRDLLAWQEVLGERGERLFLLAPRPASSSRNPILPEAYDFLRTLERDRDRAETVRLAYVAATRARRRLHILLPKTVRAECEDFGNLAEVFARLAKLKPETSPEDGAALTPPPSVAQTTMRAERVRLARPFDLLSPARGGGADARSAEPQETGDTEEAEEALDAESRIVGRVLHAALARLADRAELRPAERTIEGERAAVRRALRAEGLLADACERALEEILAALAAVLADRRGRWILAPHADARTEWTLVWVDPAGEERRLRLDRTFRDRRGRRWIVDYKLARAARTQPEPVLEAAVVRHRPQLETYARALRDYGEPRPIFLGLYFPLLRAWRCWPAAKDPSPPERRF